MLGRYKYKKLVSSFSSKNKILLLETVSKNKMKNELSSVLVYNTNSIFTQPLR